MRVSAAYAALKRRSSTVVLAVVASFIASGRVLKGRIKVKGGGRECLSHTREFELRSNGQPGAAVPTCACLGLNPGFFDLDRQFSRPGSE